MKSVGAHSFLTIVLGTQVNFGLSRHAGGIGAPADNNLGSIQEQLT
jgi:hypothetical protein